MGFHKAPNIDKVFTQFCKHLLGVNRKAINAAVFNELGVLPMKYRRYMVIIKYWLNLLKTNNCILKEIYMNMVMTCNECTNWATNVKTLLETNGFYYVWESQNVLNESLFLKEFSTRLKDNFLQEIRGIIGKSSKCYIYKFLTDNFTLQYYLTKNISMEKRKNISRIRLSAHPLKVEKGRYQNIPKKERVCTHCNVIEDEYHFILTCPLYSDLRNKFIKKYYWFKPSTYKLIQLLSSNNVRELRNLGNFFVKGVQKNC